MGNLLVNNISKYHSFTSIFFLSKTNVKEKLQLAIAKLVSWLDF